MIIGTHDAGVIHCLMRPKIKRRLTCLLCVLFALYAGSYLWLSFRGRYEPAVVGSAGVKWYAWAPEGFVTDFLPNGKLKNFFLPLYFLDTRLWHTSGDAWSGDYPVHYVSKEDIGIVYRAVLKK